MRFKKVLRRQVDESQLECTISSFAALLPSVPSASQLSRLLKSVSNASKTIALFCSGVVFGTLIPFCPSEFLTELTTAHSCCLSATKTNLPSNAQPA